ncbi:hypothetical protein N0V90_010826 [Kalmusia sp. IMI 367209]|nr:hypothetical protein N0V90_010826 [Kalmusia sp. IMI 367209]
MASHPPAEIEWVQSSKHAPHKPSFLDLPRELRNIVYEFGFRVSGAVFIYCSDAYAWRPILKGKIVKYKNEGPSEPQRVDGAIPTGLLRTCRQMHAEVAEVLYGQNVFRLYMSTADFAPSYCHLVRHITFTMEAGRGIYNEDLEVMSYWWRRVFWPNIVDKSTNLLSRYPNLETLTFPIKSDQLGVTWRPAFLAVEQKTKKHRIALAARWLGINCPMRDEQLRQVLHLEIMPSTGLLKEDFEGSRFSMEDDAEWDGSELAEAFQEMKSYLMRQA